MYKMLEKMLNFGLYLVPFLVLIVLPGTFYPFIFVRTIIFQVLIEILGILWLVLAIKKYNGRGGFKTSGLFWAVLVFWAVNLLATIFSVSPGVSFFGKAMRMDGFMFLSHVVLWFLLLVSEFKTVKNWTRFFSVSAILGGLVSLVGITQYFFNFSPGYIFKTDRIFSFLGNSSFLAGYLLFFIFITLALLAESRGWKARIFWAGVLLVDLIAFYNARSRGALLGLLLGVGLLIFLTLISKERSKKIKIASVAVFVLIIASGVTGYFLSRTSLINSFPALQRFSGITDPANYGTRIIGAEVALDGIKEKPLLGWGPANYDLIFDKYYRPESLKFTFAETVWDKPHNYVLEMGATAGIFGLVSFLAIYILAFLGIWQAKKNNNISGFIAGVFYAFLLAKFIFIVSAFDTPEPMLMFFAFLAYINFLGKKGDPTENASAGKFRGLAQIICLLVFIALILCAVFNVKNILLSTSVAKASEALYANEFTWRDNVLKMLNERSSYRDDMLTVSFVDLTAWEKYNANIDEILQPVLDPMIAALKDAEKRNPSAFIYPFQLGQAYGMRGDYMGDREAFKSALDALDRAIKISGKHQSVYLIKGKIYMTMGNSAKAIEEARKAVELYPEAPMSHWFLGLALMQNGQEDEAFKELEKRDYYELSQSEILYMITLYDQRKMYSKIVQVYKDLIYTDTKNAAEYWARLAATYLMMGDKNNASMAASQALTLDPSLKAGIGEFLKQLEKLN
jgi:O-antigen ligase/tetratricopeptide (TPR) repeat protein